MSSFNFRLFDLYQTLILHKLFLIKSVFILWIIIVSPRESIQLLLSMELSKSLIYNRNKIGPNTDPLGTPQLIYKISDLSLLFIIYVYILFIPFYSTIPTVLLFIIKRLYGLLTQFHANLFYLSKIFSLYIHIQFSCCRSKLCKLPLQIDNEERRRNKEPRPYHPLKRGSIR